MKTIIQKGVAGLGNRMQILGWCVDLAETYKARVLVDWRDSSWRMGFSKYFRVKEPIVGNYAPGDEKLPITPEWWINTVQSSEVQKGFVRVKPCHLESNWETLIVCQYLFKHSPRLFEVLDFSEEIYDEFNAMNLGEYDCWHIRALDKTGGDHSNILEAIKETPSTARTKVVITDNLDCKKSAIEMGFTCPSIIPPVPEKGGLHRVNDAMLKEAGLTKHTVNRAACADILVGAHAVNFHATCGNSTFSGLVNKIRGKK